MSLLFHHPLCPHSRFIRLALAEYGVDADLFEEKVHERREDFLLIDPAGRTPVLIDDGGLVVPGAGPIAEWLDEACRLSRIDTCLFLRSLPFYLSLFMWLKDRYSPAIRLKVNRAVVALL